LNNCKAADVIINQKCLLPIPWGWLIRSYAKHLVFEFDDALWLRQGRPYNWFTQQRVNSRLRWWLKNSDVVTCTNEYLASYARRFCNKVYIIPTGINLPEIGYDSKALPSNGDFVLGWSGSSSSVRYLKSCEDALVVFLKLHPQAKVRILCNQKPELQFPFEFEIWSREAENEFFSSLTIALLPLNMSDEFALGKYPVKALSAMAYGVPVLGNMSKGGPGEMERKGGCVSVENTNDWVKVLEALLDDRAYQTVSYAALKNVRENHDIRETYKRWRNMLLER
jgi:glycosyltransferase involved in cell wall biosynthesis